tara:strand:+ start:503 stop:706 length:204 start_codon:yes stop_codon:yes gene_type:complete
MKNLHNMNIFNTSLEEAIKVALFYKDKQGRLRKKTNDYSGLQAAFANELYVDGGVVRTRPTTKDAKE